jgi:hypothetical protein
MSTPTDQAADVSCRTSSSLLVSRCQPHTYGWCGVTCWIYMNIPKACPKKGLVMLTENWSSRTNGQYLSMCVYIYIYLSKYRGFWGLMALPPSVFTGWWSPFCSHQLG